MKVPAVYSERIEKVHRRSVIVNGQSITFKYKVCPKCRCGDLSSNGGLWYSCPQCGNQVTREFLKAYWQGWFEANREFGAVDSQSAEPLRTMKNIVTVDFDSEREKPMRFIKPEFSGKSESEIKELMNTEIVRIDLATLCEAVGVMLYALGIRESLAVPLQDCAKRITTGFRNADFRYSQTKPDNSAEGAL